MGREAQRSGVPTLLTFEDAAQSDRQMSRKKAAEQIVLSDL